VLDVRKGEMRREGTERRMKGRLREEERTNAVKA